MLTIRIRHRHGRHEAAQPSREMPAMPPPPEWASPLLSWLERKARGEWCNPEHEDWYRALRRRLDRWERQQRMG